MRKLVVLALTLTGWGAAPPAAPTPTANTAAVTSGVVTTPSAETGSPAASAQTDQPTIATTAPRSPSPTAARSPTDSARGMFENPVIPVDFPDPHVVAFDGVYYAYATRAPVGGIHYQVATSANLVDWEVLGDAMPQLPSWADPAQTWAPSVWETSAGYVMYFSAVRKDNGEACIAMSVASAPEGPFVAVTDTPTICTPETYTIDGSPLEEGGRRYLTFTTLEDPGSRMWLQELTADGLALVGDRLPLGAAADQPWEGDTVENPFILRRGDTYYLFYSGNSYRRPEYAVGYATASTLHGPYVDAPKNPILRGDTSVPRLGRPAGTGGQSIFEDPDGDLWVAYHAWDAQRVGYEVGGERTMWIDEIMFEDGVPVVMGPDAGPQPVP